MYLLSLNLYNKYFPFDFIVEGNEAKRLAPHSTVK